MLPDAKHESFIPGPFDAERLDVYRVARDLLAEIYRLTASWRDAELVDQARRAALSSFLNIAEGASQPRGSGAKRRHYAIARASAGEVAATVDGAMAIGRCQAGQAAFARSLAARICAMLTKLCGA